MYTFEAGLTSAPFRHFTCHSPPSKNSTPRQPNLVPGSVASLKVTFFDNSAQSLEGLEHYSHVWLVFFFHLNDNVAVKPKVRRLMRFISVYQ